MQMNRQYRATHLWIWSCKIKQFSDCSILELTRTIRLKKAAELIQTQQYSVQEVSEMVGFNDTATFRKRFTEQYGTTPSQYGQP